MSITTKNQVIPTRMELNRVADLREFQQTIDRLILQTPSGDYRNSLTDINLATLKEIENGGRIVDTETKD